MKGYGAVHQRWRGSGFILDLNVRSDDRPLSREEVAAIGRIVAAVEAELASLGEDA